MQPDDWFTTTLAERVEALEAARAATATAAGAASDLSSPEYRRAVDHEEDARRDLIALALLLHESPDLAVVRVPAAAS